jgi:ATP-binding cassette, subfamily B, bacterial
LSPQTWQRLLRQIHTPESLIWVWCFGIASALLGPALLVMWSWFMQLLQAGHESSMNGGQTGLPEVLTAGQFLKLPTNWLNAGSSALRGVFGFVALFLVVLAMAFIAVLTCYRTAVHTSLEIATGIQRRLFERASAFAIEKGLSGQQEAIRDTMFVDVPQIRETANQWYRCFPRYLVQSLVALALAISIQPAVTLLFVLSSLILWLIFNRLDSVRRKQRPVLLERARTSSEQLAYLCETSPLLASVHDHEDTKAGFEGQLHAYKQAYTQLSDGGVIRSPLMLGAGAALSGFLLVVVSIRYMDGATQLHLGEVVVLFLALALSAFSFFRLFRAYRRLKQTEPAVVRVAAYLEQTTQESGNEIQKQRPAKLGQIQLEHVTIRNSTGQKLLEDVSLNIKPGTLTAIVSTESVQANALAEMILGFGRPTSGRILLNGQDCMDVDPEYLREHSLWVSSHGPLVQGTVEENLWAGVTPDASLDLMACIKRMRVADSVLNLPDGLMTLVTPNEDRLSVDDLFRLGLTRALVKRPSLIVAQEPDTRVSAQVESATLEAIQQLKQPTTTLILLPKRLSTLRAADQIVLVSGHRIAGIGRHAELLMNSESYRHFNYMHFSTPA